ncbi:VanZ family protein [Treponema zioleckii]|uniref:VanZ family protein n=1 Tax=Treponema zioleckii TaxID=331680 RepID=UPI00168B754F|nr:VanZ family protein [Treponema zioleckii]
MIFSTSWYLSSQEKIESMPDFWNADKVVHLICYAGLSFWVSFACNIKAKRQFALPALITSAYGIIDEIHQSLVPGRTASIFDWMADSFGGVLGAFFYIFVIFGILSVRKHFLKRQNDYSGS